MKILSIYITSVLLLLLFSFPSCKEKTKKAEPKTPEVYYPFSSRLDLDFLEGNKQYSNIVLNIWRGYSSGNLLSYREHFADSIKLVLHDETISGGTDSILKVLQLRRDQLSTVQAHIDFWQPVYEREKNEHWVLLWVSHEGTRHDKKLDSYSLHQIWKFNDEGKIFFMNEFRSGWNW